MREQHGSRAVGSGRYDEYLQKQGLAEVLQKFARLLAETRVAFGNKQDIIDERAEFMAGWNARELNLEIGDLISVSGGDSDDAEDVA